MSTVPRSPQATKPGGLCTRRTADQLRPGQCPERMTRRRRHRPKRRKGKVISAEPEPQTDLQGVTDFIPLLMPRGYPQEVSENPMGWPNRAALEISASPPRARKTCAGSTGRMAFPSGKPPRLSPATVSGPCPLRLPTRPDRCPCGARGLERRALAVTRAGAAPTPGRVERHRSRPPLPPCPPPRGRPAGDRSTHSAHALLIRCVRRR